MSAVVFTKKGNHLKILKKVSVSVCIIINLVIQQKVLYSPTIYKILIVIIMKIICEWSHIVHEKSG